MYPPGFQTWVDVERLALELEGAFRPGPLPRRRDRLPEALHIVRPDVAYFGQKDAQQVAVLRRWSTDLDARSRDPRRSRPSATTTASPSRRATPCLSPDERERALARCRARSRRAATAASARRDALLDGRSTSTTSRSRRFDGRPVLAAAVRVGGTRLIDNVPLKEETA